MAAFQVAALALFAFVQVSSACCVGHGHAGGYNGCNDAVVVDVDSYCASTYGGYGGYGCGGLGGYGYGGYGNGYGAGYGGYGYGNGCGCGCNDCCAPVTEVTTVSCVPVVETFVDAGCGNGYGYNNGFYGGLGGYGYGGYCNGYGAGYGGYGYGNGCGCGCNDCCAPVTEVTTVSCVPVVDTFVDAGCGNCHGYNGGFYGGLGGYGYGGYGNGYGAGYGGYGYGNGCGCGCNDCCAPVTEVTTVSCVPVVDTFVDAGCGNCHGYNGGFYGGLGGYGYGYPGYGYGSGYGYGHGHGCGCSC